MYITVSQGQYNLITAERSMSMVMTKMQLPLKIKLNCWVNTINMLKAAYKSDRVTSIEHVLLKFTQNDFLVLLLTLKFKVVLMRNLNHLRSSFLLAQKPFNSLVPQIK